MVKHCWHQTGESWTNGLGFAGGWKVRCCNCGTCGDQPWTKKTVRVGGHGPYEVREIQQGGRVVPRDSADCTPPTETPR